MITHYFVNRLELGVKGMKGNKSVYKKLDGLSNVVNVTSTESIGKGVSKLEDTIQEEEKKSGNLPTGSTGYSKFADSIPCRIGIRKMDYKGK